MGGPRREPEASGEFYRSVLEDSPMLVAVARAAVEAWHSAAVDRAYRVPSGAPMAEWVAELVHPEDRDTAQALIDEAGEVEPAEIRVLDAAGNWRVLAIIKRDLTDRPAVAGTVYYATDVTRARTAEARARVESARLAALVDALGVGVLVEDERRRILVANPAFVEMFELGTAAAALAGARLSELACPARWAALAAPERDTGVIELRLPGDRVVEASYTPVRPDGAADGRLWVFRDVTEAAAARRALAEHNARLAALSALKSEFIAVVSHELRTPLTSIASMVELLRGNALSERDTGEAMSAVLRNTERMLTLVEDLNVLANLESDGLRGPGTPVDVADLVRDAARVVDALSAQVTVQATVPDGPPVDGDAKLLAQLMHAVIGAVASLATTDPVTVTGSVDAAGWTIAARAYATDLGTSERLLAAALPDADTGPHRRSVALSVLLARAIATSHNGTLTMEQEPDGQASITVRLPVSGRL